MLTYFITRISFAVKQERMLQLAQEFVREGKNAYDGMDAEYKQNDGKVLFRSE